MDSTFVVVLMVFAMINEATSRDAANFTKCKDIPLQQADYQTMIKLSPVYIYLTNTELFNCSQVAFLGYAGAENNYTGTAIVFNNKRTISYDVTQKNDSIFEAKSCSDGLTSDYRVIYYNFKSLNETSYCVVVCDQFGDTIQSVVCIGRTTQDFKDTETFLKTVDTPTATPVFNSYNSCPKPLYCASFN